MTEKEVRQRIEQAAREGPTGLRLSDEGLTALPPEIGQLSQLRKLDLGNNQLSALPPEIGQLTQLQELHLFSNQLTALPPEIGQLTQLHTLWLHGNQLSALPPEIGQLFQLRRLGVVSNQLTVLPPEIGQLTQFQGLGLSDNQLTTLPAEIGQLTQLQTLYLRDNQLTALPPEIERLTQLKRLFLHGNEALGIPPEILGPTADVAKPRGTADPANPADILAYYFRSRRETTRPLNEAKILLVGQGAVGKTSLVKRLVENEFDAAEGKTEGINITQWKVPGKGERAAGDVRLNIWDFGGQEIMHATHQFFLTKRSLYLLVLDARKGENEGNIHYWLRIIQSYGGDSPVLVVINKNEPPNHLELNETRLTKDSPNIKGFFKTSCRDSLGIRELLAAIEEQIQQLPHVYDMVPASYFAVKQELETKAVDEDFIDIGEYRKLCRRQGVEGTKEQTRLIRFLHDLGNVLNFDDPDSPYRLEQTKVLNPEWVTGGVYKILNNVELMKRGGVLNIGELGGILDDSQRYPPQHRRFIVDMMRQFELCFTFPGSGGKEFLIPELLQPNEPDLNWEEQDALNFQYHYAVLPGGILPRFIVRTHQNLTKKPTYWQSGVVLGIDGCKALVRGDTQAGRVYISIQGSVPARRRATLAVIRDQFRQIHATIPKIGAEEKVPLPDEPGVAVGYAHLLTLEQERIERFFPEGAKRAYDVQELLNGIEDVGERADKRRRVGDPGGGGVEDPKPKPDSDRSKATERPLDLEMFRTVVRYLLGAVVVIVGAIASVYKWVPDTPQVIMLAGIALVVVVLVFAAAFTGVFGEKTSSRIIERVIGLFKKERSGDSEDGADAAD